MYLVDIVMDDHDADIPDKATMEQWANTVLSNECPAAEVCIKVVSTQTITGLNAQYRHTNKPTNVLSFPALDTGAISPPHLGDVVVCAEVVAQEANEQKKSLDAHWAHMITHGILHLCGHDHIKPSEATIMEQKETEILALLGFPCPYSRTT